MLICDMHEVASLPKFEFFVKKVLSTPTPAEASESIQARSLSSRNHSLPCTQSTPLPKTSHPTQVRTQSYHPNPDPPATTHPSEKHLVSRNLEAANAITKTRSSCSSCCPHLTSRSKPTSCWSGRLCRLTKRWWNCLTDSKDPRPTG